MYWCKARRSAPAYGIIEEVALGSGTYLVGAQEEPLGVALHTWRQIPRWYPDQCP